MKSNEKTRQEKINRIIRWASIVNPVIDNVYIDVSVPPGGVPQGKPAIKVFGQIVHVPWDSFNDEFIDAMYDQIIDEIKRKGYENNLDELTDEEIKRREIGEERYRVLEKIGGKDA